MKRFAAVGAVLVVVTSAVAFQSGGTGGWQSYTTMRSVRSVTTSGARAWAATSGGVFLYESASNQFSKFTNTDGLSSNDVTAMTEDREGRLWFGTSEGFINVYDPVEETWMEIRSIAESNRVLKAVRTLAAQNDTMFVGTDFGVVVYLMTRGEFGDTYANFGFLAQPKVNHILVHRNDIWVATESGVARASLSSANLSAPTAWSRYQGTTAASTNMLSLAVFRDTVYAGTSGGVSYFLNGFFIDLPQFNNASVVGIRPSGQTSGDKLYVLRNSGTGFTVEAIGSTTSSAEFVASSTVSSASALGNFPAFGNLWVGTTKQGLARWNGTAWEYHAPNGPQSNLFISL
ncbi:MAG TPA: two-component regulator propeller domain-containing protein, partial [Bacteroidota bacterium]